MQSVNRVLGAALFAGTLLVSTSIAQLPAGAQITGGMNSRLGAAVDRIGDADGDGLPDLVIGAPSDSTLAPNGGRAMIVSGLSGAVITEIFGTNADDNLGNAVAGLGDLDGDAVPDFAVGVPGDDTMAGNAGTVLVVSGASGAIIYTVRGATNLEGLGNIVASAGDVDGDGVEDILGATPAGIGMNAGRYVVISGSSGAIVRTSYSVDPNRQFGRSAAALGDVNGDGFADIGVGAIPLSPGLFGGTGVVYVFSGADGSILYVLSGPLSTNLFGFSVSAVPDVDGDGQRDLVVGDPYSLPTSPQGRVHVLSSANGLVFTTINGTSSPIEFFGRSVIGVPDLDGNGAADIVIAYTAPDQNNIITPGVRVFDALTGTLLGQHAGPPDIVARAVVAPAGDLDGDGFFDIVAGWSHASGGNGRAEALSVCGSRLYGTSLGAGLSLNYSGVANGTSYPGNVVISGASPGSAGIIFVSEAPAQTSISGFPVLVDLGAPTLTQNPFSFDGNGAFVLALDLKQPTLPGVRVFGQALSGNPLAVSNGLALLLCP